MRATLAKSINAQVAPLHGHWLPISMDPLVAQAAQAQLEAQVVLVLQGPLVEPDWVAQVQLVEQVELALLVEDRSLRVVMVPCWRGTQFLLHGCHAHHQPTMEQAHKPIAAVMR